MSTQNPTQRRDFRAEQFATNYGVGCDYTSDGRSILTCNDWDGDVSDLDMEQGALIGPGVVVGFYFDWDHYDPPSADFVDALTAAPESIYHHGHNGTPATTFEAPEGGKSCVTKKYVDKAEAMFGVDFTKNPWLVSLHPTENFPVKIDDPDPDSDVFLLIAPRVMTDD
jgi:hypothetical protein